MYRLDRPMSLFLLVVGFLGLTPIIDAQTTRKLTLQIFGLKNQQGQLCWKVFTKDLDFPYGDQGVLQRQCRAITKRPLQVTMDNLPLGNYAIAVIHDTNNDQQLQKNFWGIPEEGFGFSNNPSVTLKTGPAKFKDAQFNFSGTNTYLNITIKYSLDPS